MSSTPLRWGLAGALLVGVLVAVLKGHPAREVAAPEFVGNAACAECHQSESVLWDGSDHDLAMDVATDPTVLGDFDNATFTAYGIESRFYRRDGRFLVFTEGPGGAMQEFEVTHVFGHDPLQQYLVPFPGGRLQCLNIAWDTVRGEWFQLSPDRKIDPSDWLHWTRGGQNWNGMCAECHSTNLVKGYDAAIDSFATTWSQIDVGCEACHGPGSSHVHWARRGAQGDQPDGLVLHPKDMSSKQLVDSCAPCHSRRSELADYDHQSTELLDFMLPSLLREGLYHPDGQIHDEVYVYGSFVQSRMYQNEVSCRDCHDPHSLQLRFEGNALCEQCHKADIYDTPKHHFHQLEVGGVPSPAANCVECHMPEQPFMVIDWRADHSLRIPRPDLSARLGTPNACSQSGCHADQPLEWVVQAFTRWYGEAQPEHFGTAFAAARHGDRSADADLARIAQSPQEAPLVRATALELLSFSGSARFMQVCTPLLSDPEPVIRQSAVSVLQPGSARQAVVLLAPLLADRVRAVRMAASSRLAGVDRANLTAAQRERLAETTVEYRTSMESNLDFASSAMNLATLALRENQPADGERFLRRALEIDDRFTPARTNLAVLLSTQGRDAEAGELLEEGTHLAPDDAENWRMLGLALAASADPERGVEPLEAAVRLVPDDARTRYNLGLLLQQLGRLPEAETQLRAALEIEPRSADYLYALADHYLKRGRYDAVLPLADRLTEALPDQPVGAQLRALAESAGNR